MKTYLEATEAAGARLFQRGITGPVTMLNLLRLRELADYSDHPELAPAEPITGRQAYQLYIEHTLPFLRASGGELIYLGEGGPFLIGPEGDGWDLAMLVRQDSLESFVAFASNQEYLAGIGHRTAATWDSRIVPLVDQPLS
ncbi:MAG: DUF1330 domain-containing protein [Acidobacteriota bacterium]